MKTTHLFILTFLLSVIACKSTSKDEIVAQEICDCLKPMVEMYEKMEAEANNADSDALIQTMEDLERLAAESQECSDRLMKKYEDLEQRQDRVEAIMQKTCPNVVRILTEFGD